MPPPGRGRLRMAPFVHLRIETDFTAHVLRNLPGWVGPDHDRPHICGGHAPRAHPLDCRWRACVTSRWVSSRRNEPERKTAHAIWPRRTARCLVDVWFSRVPH